MKKAISLALICTLALCGASAALSQALYHEESGITFNVPEGFSAQDASTDEVTALILTDEKEPDLSYVYEVSYLEDLEGLWLEDLSEEMIQGIAEAMAGDVGALDYEVAEEAGAHYLMIVNEDRTFAGLISILNGWVCGLYTGADEGMELTDVAWDNLVALQMGIEYE